MVVIVRVRACLAPVLSVLPNDKQKLVWLWLYNYTFMQFTCITYIHMVQNMLSTCRRVALATLHGTYTPCDATKHDYIKSVHRRWSVEMISGAMTKIRCS